MNFKQASLVLGLCAAGIISACIDDADSHSGVSAAEFDLYKAEVAAQIAALQANQPGDKVFAALPASLAKATSAEGKPLGTAVGFLPADVPIYRAQQLSLKSSSGFLYGVPTERSAAVDGAVGISGIGPVYFVSADCTGQAYVTSAQVGDYGAQQGVVFRISAGPTNSAYNDPAQYYYVPAGTERVLSLTVNSLRTHVDVCDATAETFFAAYAAQQNDPAVTGVDNAPLLLPITMAEPVPAP